MIQLRFLCSIFTHYKLVHDLNDEQPCHMCCLNECSVDYLGDKCGLKGTAAELLIAELLLVLRAGI